MDLGREVVVVGVGPTLRLFSRGILLLGYSPEVRVGASGRERDPSLVAGSRTRRLRSRGDGLGLVEKKAQV